jgi:hypothetical protein
MTEHSPFDHTPDPLLGEALREVLAIGDDPGFVRQVLDRIRAPEPWWEVLGDWARPGVAAAMIITAVGGFLLGRLVAPEPAGLAAGENGSAIGLEVTVLLTDGGPPDVESILGDGSQ